MIRLQCIHTSKTKKKILSGSFIFNENDHLTFSVFVHIHGPVSLPIIVFDFILSVGVDLYKSVQICYQYNNQRLSRSKYIFYTKGWLT